MMTRGLNVRDDTIAAIATPVSGTGGIGVLRVSGKRSEDICRRIFRPRRRGSRFESHRLYLGDIVGDDDSMVIDEVLVALMRAPHSYTGEDVLEISCHGNPLILKALLARVLKAGARVAEPGEFTRRAFLNGRIDLAQAEAVADLVSASSEQARRQALYALRGDLSRRIGVIRTLLLEVLAGLEASIDFTEEDISHPEGGQYDRLLEEAISAMRATVASYDRGTLYRRGLTAVITGRPNVGKSSLLNRLAGEERAIVTDQPGTTRDYIDVEVALQDMVVRFVDTAGIRLSDLEIEREGVRHARERAGEADLVIILLDGSEGLRDGDAAIAEENQGRSILPLVNKCDLPLRISADEVARLLPGAASPLFVSAKENRGINDLKERIIQEYRSEAGDPGDVVLTNLRHRDALKEALECAERARRALAAGASPELPAFDIGEALRRVAVITGETVTDEVLETIFSRFCVGK